MYCFASEWPIVVFLTGAGSLLVPVAPGMLRDVHKRVC